jgi:hypothetical protein
VTQLELTRYARGLERLAEVGGNAGEEIITPLDDLGRYWRSAAAATSSHGWVRR